jgi:hypothetical protein
VKVISDFNMLKSALNSSQGNDLVPTVQGTQKKLELQTLPDGPVCQGGC